MECKGRFFGSVTVGERGQVVIPAEARAELGFHPGDKLLVMKHPGQPGVMMFKFEDVRQFLDEMQSSLESAQELGDGE